MKKVLGRLFWIIVILLMCLWTFEFYRIRNGYNPMFCFKTSTHTYTDGTTTECIGLGYKVYKYNRTDLYGTEFVSIFAKERNKDNSIDTTDTNEDTSTDTDSSTNQDTTDGSNTDNTQNATPEVTDDGSVITPGTSINQDDEVVGE